ncbi:MAG: T9SS type A sorting domain-containing protein, partial [Bacteroidales bacterium]
IGATIITEKSLAALSSMDSMEYTFNTLYDFSKTNQYELVVWGELERDCNATNDTVRSSIVCTQADVDAGVVSICSPVAGNVSQNENLTIVVKNFSQVSLSQIAVECNINDLNLRGIVVGPIKAHDSLVYTFQDKVDMSARKKYEITAYTLLPHDIDPSNDLCVITIDNASIQTSSTFVFELYPNPTHDKLYITSSVPMQSLRICNALGQNLFYKEKLFVSNYNLSVQGYKAGMYYIDVKFDDKNHKKVKLIIQ